MSDTLTQILGNFTYHLKYEDLPSEVVEKCKTVIMHGIGVALCGFNTEIGNIGIRVAKKIAGNNPGGATILVDGSRVPPAAAAFANATMFHALAEEDTYMKGLLHSGVCVIPPALAIGEIKRSTGKELIVSVAAGYEVGARISENFAQLGVARGFRATTVYGPIIATLATAKLLGLGENQMVTSLGWGANLAFGLIEWGLAKTYEMPLQSGFVASNGIIAAYLGQCGAVTASTILEGDKGLYKSFAGSQENLGKIAEGLGKEYKMVATELKRNPAGGHAQTPALAILQLLHDTNFNASDVKGIEVRLNPGDTTYPGYKSMQPGLINVRYLIAISCIKKKLSPATLSLDNSPQVIELMSKVAVIDDEDVPSETCKLIVNLKDRTLIKDLDMRDKWAFSLNDEIEWQKNQLISEMAIEAEKANQMIEIIRNLESCSDMTELVKILISPGAISRKYRIVF